MANFNQFWPILTNFSQFWPILAGRPVKIHFGWLFSNPAQNRFLIKICFINLIQIREKTERECEGPERGSEE